MTSYCEDLKSHYAGVWGNRFVSKQWNHGPVADLPESFSVLEFAPSDVHGGWTYATCGMAHPYDDRALELHLLSPVQADEHVELLTVIAHYHLTGESLGLGHTINFGRPWFRGSQCSFGLISLPYLAGPALERFVRTATGHVIPCLWLIPITEKERDFKMNEGLEMLEQLFETVAFNYLDPMRRNVVE